MNKPIQHSQLEPSRIDYAQALQRLVAATSNFTGQEFLQALAHTLAETLAVRYVMIGRTVEGKLDRVRTAVLWADGGLRDNIEYALDGAPCENVVAKVECFYPAGVQQLFPRDAALAAWAVDSYFGLPLNGSDGGPIGLLALLDPAPMDRLEHLRPLVRVLADRAAAELERADTTARLRESEQRFRSLSELSSDFYWEQDEQFRFVQRIGLGRDEHAYTLEEVIGKAPWEFPALNLAPVDWARHRADLEAHREFHDFELERRLPSGEARWISTSGHPIFDAAGRFRGYRGIGKNITARKLAEKALRESEERFRSLTALSSDYYWETDAGHRMTRRSESGGDSSAFADAQRWLGKRRWEIPYESPGEAGWRAHRETLEAHQPFQGFEFTRRAQDGSIAHFSIDGEPMSDARGRFCGFRGVGHNVTAQKIAEQALQSRETQLRLLTDNVPAMIGYTDRENRFLYANRDLNELYGRPGVAVLGRTIPEVVGEIAWPQVRPNIERALAGERVHYAGRRLHRSGEWRDVEVTLVPHRDDAGSVIGVYTFILDVTERERAAEVVRSAAEELKLITDNVPEMISYVGTDLRYRFANRKYAGFFASGFPSLRGVPMAEALGAELWRQVQPRVERALAGETLHYERAIAGSDGTVRDMEVRLLPHLDPAGRVQGIYSLLLDVTERKRSDKALHLRTRALKASTNSVMITEGQPADFRLVYVNPAFERITGYPAAEVLGRNPRFLHGTDRDQQGLDELRRAARENRQATALLRNYRKDGTMFWSELRVAPVRDDDDHVTHFVGIASDVTERMRYESQLEQNANYDSLSGLPNRNLFGDRLRQAVARARRSGLLAAVLYLDLDNFKRINDSLGHAMGDRVITAVSGRLAEALRSGDTVGRVGGDEFVILLLEIRREDDAVRVAEKMREVIAAPLYLEGHEFVLSASVGIALCPRDGGDAETLLRNADTALYRAKGEGRDGWRFFTAEMNERMVRDLTTERELRHALERREFELHFQPIVSLKGDTPVGAEALIRWRRRDGKLTPPGDFIPLAEESGLIVPIGRWVLEAAARQAKRWQRRGRPPFYVSVNVSARQFRDPGLPAMVRDALAVSGVDPSLIKLEITESTVMHDAEAATRTLHALKRLGVHISVDDFGTGYSSLAYLKRFPVDVLKIDRSFVRDLPDDEDDLAISRAVIDLARGLKLQVVAEGVEARSQAAVLAKNHCQFAQGFLFGRPVPAKEFETLLRARPARKRPVRRR